MKRAKRVFNILLVVAAIIFMALSMREYLKPYEIEVNDTNEDRKTV